MEETKPTIITYNIKGQKTKWTIGRALGDDQFTSLEEHLLLGIYKGQKFLRHELRNIVDDEHKKLAEPEIYNKQKPYCGV